MTRALRVGLTGGVASGKSTVAAAFARHGVPVFSADRVAHELTAPGAPLLAAIRAQFGDAVFAADGTLERAALAARIYDDADARARLEAILHPPIIEALRRQVEAVAAPYCVIEIPLLKPAHVGPLVDRVLVVDLAPAEQLRRLQARDDLDAAAAARIVAAQPSRAARLALADDVLVNDGPLADLEAKVVALHQRYNGRHDLL